MSKKLSFQEIILRLLAYWEEQGCLVQQPYNVQVGAGTMNPATVLRVLGPEPWNVVYVEPSIRPDDGRFGDNPNRLQMHHQLQVILKPDPGNPQELYLKSLETVGIDSRYHDIRFVEDNWESPALGAWGLGWEVWLDGQEITQFTYFQQAGGMTLDPVSVEITYGLDRIGLALQGVDSVWEMQYGAGLSYGNILLQSEIEHCEYYFNVADVDAIRRIYDTYENEAARCVEAGLVVPAHDYNLKCSHLFNILDTRGAVGVTERASYFRRMRSMAQRVSELYVAQRESLGHPMLDAWETPASTRPVPAMQFVPEGMAQTFLLEIGCEELPVGDLEAALAQLRQRVPALLTEARLAYERIVVEGTPRRLAVIVSQLADRQSDLETVVKGPPADRAFDEEGNPTRAAEGFARSKGVDVADLEVVTEGDKSYVTAVLRQEGQATMSVLAEALPQLIADLKFTRSMRWNQTDVAFSRPIRWLVALFGTDVIPFTYAGVASGRTSRGLRPYGSPDVRINDARNYAGSMRTHGIILSEQKRKVLIQTVSGKLAAEKGGEIPDDAALLTEVANLVERPTPLRGRFDERFLALPPAVLVAVMRKHQRYFPVYSEDDPQKLLAYFIAVRNGDEKHLDVVVNGNEHVIRARFADAEFFYQQDTQRPLADFVPELETLTFQADLGSMLDKTRRLERLTPAIAEMVGLSAAARETAVRAAGLAKADLATNMVVEMTSLQGVMGGHYAQLSGEPEPVVAAIAEQYEAVSETKAGLALALADRLDSLAGLFAAGLAPSGSNDPFALRRAALHVIENLTANELSFDLRAGVAAAADLLPLPCGDDVQAEVLAFIAGRLEGVLRDAGHSAYVAKAILAAQAHDPFAATRAAAALTAATEADGWPAVLDAYARCVRIVRGQSQRYELRAQAFALPAEKQLLAAYETAVAANDGSVHALVAALRGMVPAITQFFDDVLVMDEDLDVRHNRLALLQRIADLPNGIADLSHLEGF